MKLEDIVVRDEKLFFTLISYILVILIFLNASFFQLPPIGVTTTLVYVLINGIFLGHAFFDRFEFFLRLALGSFMFLMILGFTSWVVLKIYNLDVVRVTLVLFIGAMLSSLLNKWMKRKNA